MNTVPRAISFDGYGTLLALDKPFERLRGALSSAGLSVPLAHVETAFKQEMAFYRQHHTQARDAASLDELRRRCARVLFRALEDLGHQVAFDEQGFAAILMQAVRFHLYPDVLPVLDWCRARAIRTAVISNWDCGLQTELAGLGVAPDVFEHWSVSAAFGAAKPLPAIFEYTANALDLPADAILHVGDDPCDDFDAACRAGFRAVLLARDEAQAGRFPSVRSLMDLPALIMSGSGADGSS